jgi:hypothetical protein
MNGHAAVPQASGCRRRDESPVCAIESICRFVLLDATGPRMLKVLLLLLAKVIPLEARPSAALIIEPRSLV